MRRWALGSVLLTFLIFGHAAAASAQVCVTIDSARDTLLESDRAAALVLVSRQFEQEGERVVPTGCPRAFTLAHVRLLDTIVVTMTGPTGSREAVAQGSNDLLAVYSQMIRSLLTGRPMSGLNVTDRTNVTLAQAIAPRVHSDSLWYARIGYGGILGDKSYGTPSFGFGFRAELDTYAIDVGFLNFQTSGTSSYSGGASAHSIVKLSGLYFLGAEADRSPYVGAGLSYGYQRFGGSYEQTAGGYRSPWRGDGLQGELTAGYELARATSVRVFLQVDAIVPFYSSVSETYTYSSTRPPTGPPTIVTSRKYAPALVFSVGVGR